MTNNIWFNLGCGVALVAIALGLTLWNQKTREEIRSTIDPDKGEVAYLKRRYRRRGQTNLLIGSVGLAIFLGSFVVDKLMMACFWGAVLIAVLWVLWLAVLDAFDSQLHYRGLSDHYKQQEEILRREIAAYEEEQAREENGEA